MVTPLKMLLSLICLKADTAGPLLQPISFIPLVEGIRHIFLIVGLVSHVPMEFGMCGNTLMVVVNLNDCVRYLYIRVLTNISVGN